MVVAITGASAALAGLVLVFVGVLIAAYQPLVGKVSDPILQSFRRAALWALAVFGLSLASVTLDASWLIAAGGGGFYRVVLVAFFVLLAALAAIACYASLAVLLRG